jgi:hypothetical protein
MSLLNFAPVLTNSQHAHFIGIGGAGVSRIALRHLRNTSLSGFYETAGGVKRFLFFPSLEVFAFALVLVLVLVCQIHLGLLKPGAF